jgi:hypothetical protein
MIPRKLPVFSRMVTVLPTHGAKELTIIVTLNPDYS